ncbi:cysteine dioxygenase [Streptomyces sp. NPDC058691]|uniref:cysteine dioxygenase n=1 Tax=Streptomyces sp. NPDC058691 TaxID=3346601 RepID=UPI00365D43A6
MALHDRAGGPTPLVLPQLRALVRGYAEAVADGTHQPVHLADQRWYTRLHQDPYVDVWLITWPRDTSTELHDHAGSLGALTVVSGVLTEHRWTYDREGHGRITGRELAAGRGAGFPLGHVHDVVNASTAPAVSVHAYSPPLTAMAYYAVDDTGSLRRTRTVLTDAPEPAAALPAPPVPALSPSAVLPEAVR